MNGGGYGRVDSFSGRAYGLRYFVSVILVSVLTPGAAYATTIMGTYTEGADAVAARDDYLYNNDDWEGNSQADTWDAGYCPNSPGITDITDTGEPNVTYCWEIVQECPAGEGTDSDGKCIEQEECEEGETITTGFEGTGTSVCSGGCDYTTSHGMDPSGDSGSYVFDGNGFTSSNMPQRYGVWVNDGTSCSADQTPADSITTDQGTTLEFEPDQPNCGTVNGERFCAPSLPDGGKCTFVGSDGYVCGNAGDQPVVPEHDPSTTTVTENDAVTMDGINGEDTQITLSAGTIDTSTPSDGLDEGTTTPEAGSDDAKQEEEQDGFCEKNPDMCDLDDGLGDDPDTPEETLDLSNMTDSYSSGIASTSECPATENINLLGTSVEFSWTAFCDFADLIRPFVIAAGFLAAFMFAVRALA